MKNRVDTEEGQSYLVTVSDLMSGLIFVFLITLMVFAFRFQVATNEFTSAGDTRSEILNLLKQELQLRGLIVEIDDKHGVLRLTEQSILFARGSAEPHEEHLQRIGTLAAVLADVLPCFVRNTSIPCKLANIDRTKFPANIEVLLIEGHTDAVPLHGRWTYKDNIELSGARAASVWRHMIAIRPFLNDIRNRDRESILSISGYGEQRLVDQYDPLSERNRRIDLRFIMESPAGGGT